MKPSISSNKVSLFLATVVVALVARAERIVTGELKQRKWSESALAERRKGDAGKVAIAVRLREETTVTLAWIAERLRMGTKTHLAHLLYWHRRGNK